MWVAGTKAAQIKVLPGPPKKNKLTPVLRSSRAIVDFKDKKKDSPVDSGLARLVNLEIVYNVTL